MHARGRVAETIADWGANQIVAIIGFSRIARRYGSLGERDGFPPVALALQVRDAGLMQHAPIAFAPSFPDGSRRRRCNGQARQASSVRPELNVSVTGRERHQVFDTFFIGGVHALDFHAFWREQTNLPARSGGQGVNEKIGRHFVGPAHDRRGGRNDLEFAARADPIDMAVAVHDDRARRQGLDLSNEPRAVDQRRANAFGKLCY